MNKPTKNGMVKDDANLAQVRDLLFGTEIRQQEQRLEQIDARIDKEVKALRDEQRRQTSELKALIKSEIAGLAQTLKAESSQRTAATRGLAKEAKELAAVVQKTSSRVDERIAKTEHSLRTGAESAVEALREECEQQLAEQHEELSAGLDELEQATADRESLGAIFDELAKRVRKKRG